MSCNCNNVNETTVVEWVRGSFFPYVIVVTQHTTDGTTDSDGNLVWTESEYQVTDADTVEVNFRGGFANYAMTYTIDGDGHIVVDDNGEMPYGTYCVEVMITQSNGRHFRWQASQRIRLMESIPQAEMEAQILRADVFYFAKGDTGNGIEGVTLTSTVVDPETFLRTRTYTVSYTDTDDDTFDLVDVDYTTFNAAISALITGAQTATSIATEVAEHPTYVGDDNYVYQYNLSEHAYEKTDVYVKGEQGEQGLQGIQGIQGEQGASITSFTYVSEDENSVVYSANFSDGGSSEVDIPKGSKGDTGDTGATGPQGPQGVSIIAFSYVSETSTNTIYNAVFSNGVTQSVAIPKGIKGDTGDTGATGPQGVTGNGIASTTLNADYTLTITFTDGTSWTTPESIKGDTAVVDGTDTYTLYNNTGTSTTGAMTQNATTLALDNLSQNVALDTNLEEEVAQGENITYYIDNSGKWTNEAATHKIISVSTGERYRIYANDNLPCVYKWLKTSTVSPNNLADLSDVDGTKHLMNASEWVDADVPSDAHYLYLQSTMISGGNTLNYAPKKVCKLQKVTDAVALSSQNVADIRLKNKNITSDFVNDFVISDEEHYDIVQFRNGHVKTKNFDSEEIRLKNLNQDNGGAGDFFISDENNYDIVQFKNGHIKTKNFDSSDISFNSLVLNFIRNKFRGKRCAIVGDSISTYSGTSPSGYSNFYPGNYGLTLDEIWWKITCDVFEMNYTNCSWSGSRVTGAPKASSASAGCSDQRITDIGRNGNPDIIIFFIGCNDWGHSVSLGSWTVDSDIVDDSSYTSSQTVSTFKEAYSLMLYKAQTRYPSAKMFCCTILDDAQRDNVGGYPSKNGSNVSTNTWNLNIKEIASAMGIDVIDMHACGLNYANIHSYVVDSGLHPNAVGHAIMAKKVISELISK